ARPAGPADAQLETDVAVEPHAVDLLADAVDHRLAEREVVELEDQVPGPRAGRDGADLVHVVAEGGDDARAARLPVGEERLEGGQEAVALLVLGEVEVRGQAATEDEHAMSHRPPTL